MSQKHANRRKTLEQCEADLHPWKIWSEPSIADARLVRLCIGHSHYPKYFILETYYRDEIEHAIDALKRFISTHKKKLNPAVLRQSHAPVSWVNAVPTSRSTVELSTSRTQQAVMVNVSSATLTT